MKPTKYDTIDQGKKWLRENLRDGENCPCCNRWAKLNPYSMHSGVAATLIKMYRYPLNGKNRNGPWIHVEDMLVENGSTIKGVIGKAKYWGLVKQQPNIDDPTKNKNGFWALTPKGAGFVKGLITIHKTALVFNDKAYSFRGKRLDIKAALGNKFNYSEMMNS